MCAAASKYLPKMTLDNPADLPCTKPAPYNYKRVRAQSLAMSVWNGTAWVRPPIVRDTAFATTRKNSASGAVKVTMRHARIKEVTPAMVRWMWNNMDKQVADPRDGKKWQVRSDIWNTLSLCVSMCHACCRCVT
jgi:hypothetical protein